MYFLFILLGLIIVIIVIRAITKNRNTQESQLGVFEHPSTFKKPKIEMTTKETNKSVSIENSDGDSLDDAFDVWRSSKN